MIANPLLTPDKEKALLDGLYDALDDAHHKKGSPGYGDMSVLARWGSREGIEALAGILNLTYGRPCFGNSFKYLQKEAREALLTCPEPLGRFYSGFIVRSVTEICFAVN